jgi:MFS superfamily sulfate permease-like transporter
MKTNLFGSLSKDFPAGVVVFLVALPLCLGIALASGAPLFAGVIAGIIGGVVCGFLSGSSLGVSGPAAGLTVIVLNAITEIGVYESFLLAVVLAGIFQILFSFIGAGKIAYFFPLSVIKGMLSAIGIIIILKQIPHALGIDKDFEGDETFMQNDGENTFSEILHSLDIFNEGALIIGLLSIAVLVFWDKLAAKNKFFSTIPGALACVILGIGLNVFYPGHLTLYSEHLVKLPIAGSFGEFGALFKTPNFGAITNLLVWKTAIVLAIIASIETLLCVEATDRLDPYKRITPTNRELVAQGAGNIISGLLGGLPLTQVIVRSSANIQSGGKTKMSAIIHGLLLFVCVVIIPGFLNKIPLAALAAVLIMVGYKLTKPSLFKQMYQEGQDQFVPFVATILGVVFTDLLTGICIGLGVRLLYVIYTNFKSSIATDRDNNIVLIKFKKDVFFYNQIRLKSILNSVRSGDTVFVDGSKASFVDSDIYMILKEFQQNASLRNIKVELREIRHRKLEFKLK